MILEDLIKTIVPEQLIRVEAYSEEAGRTYAILFKGSRRKMDSYYDKFLQDKINRILAFPDPEGPGIEIWTLANPETLRKQIGLSKDVWNKYLKTKGVPYESNT